MKVRRTGVQGWALAIAVHATVLGAVLIGDPPPRDAPVRRPPVKIRLVAPRRATPPQPEPAEPPAAVKAPAPAPRADRPRPPRATPRRPARQVAAATPPPADAPARPAAAPRFSVSMSATVPSGGVAVPTSPGGSASPLAVPDWAGRSRDAEPASETATAGGGSSRPLEVTEVSSSPRLVAQPSASALRAAYPPRAREEGLEGNVVLRILVGKTGRVKAVRVVRRAGHGFDEAAQRLVRGFRFAAGTKDGQPVAVWIPWTYKFRLNG